MVYSEIVAALLREKADFRVIEHAPVLTMQDVTGLELFGNEPLLKTLLYISRNELLAGVILGHHRLSIGRLAAIMGVSRGSLQMASAIDIMSRLGVEVGGISPIISPAEGRVVFDMRIVNYERVCCGIGRRDRTLQILTKDLVKVVAPHLGSIAITAD